MSESASKFCMTCGAVNPIFPQLPGFCTECGGKWVVAAPAAAPTAPVSAPTPATTDYNSSPLKNLGEVSTPLGVPVPNCKVCPDVPSCEKCDRGFTVFRRKHHCKQIWYCPFNLWSWLNFYEGRTCGHVFCSDCRSIKCQVKTSGFNFPEAVLTPPFPFFCFCWHFELLPLAFTHHPDNIPGLRVRWMLYGTWQQEKTQEDWS